MGNNIADFSTRRLGENRIPFSYYADAGWAVRSAATQLLQPELDLVSYSDIHISSKLVFYLIEIAYGRVSESWRESVSFIHW